MKPKKLRQEAEEKLKNQPPNDDLSLEATKFLVHELLVHRTELEMQNEELRETQHRLEEVLDQYTDLFDFAPIGYFILDTKGIIIKVNLTGCSMLGMNRDQVTNKPFATFIAQERQGSQTFFAYLKKAFLSDDVISCDLLLKNKSGKNIPVQLDGMSEFDEFGLKSRIRITIQDRSTEKETEKLKLLNEALIKEKERAQLFLDVAGTMFVLIDTNHIVQMINQKGCEILGCSEENVVGKNWFERFVPEKDREQAIANFDVMLNHDSLTLGRFNQSLLGQNGMLALISCHHSQIRDEENKVIGLLCSGTDITEQKEAENALIESERMFRELFRTAAKSIVMTNGVGEITAMNKFAQKMFGYEEGELYGRSIKVLLPGQSSASPQGHPKPFAAQLEAFKKSEELEFFAIKKGGRNSQLK